MSLRILFTSLTALLISFTSGWSETIPKYDRDLFGGWADFDKDCQNTRHETLQELSTSTFTLNRRQCRVLRGRWYDPYTDRFFTESKDVDIDHLVPLFYAWKRGAYAWEFDERRKFANDTRNLFVVDKRTNREKSASGPTEWLPPNISFRCQYIVRFQRIVKLYNLILDPPEARAIAKLQEYYC